jgi:K+-sensing histidine kinase KdpD
LILLTLIYLTFILSTLTKFSNNSYLETDITSSVYILAIFAFVIIYALFSVLVVLFNLPTSSVFEQKMEEVINFQKLSQSLQIDQKEIDVYNILIDTSFSTLLADAAWLEVFGENKGEITVKREIADGQIEQIREALYQNSDGSISQLYNKNINKSKFGKKLNKIPYHSIAVIPILAKSKTIGIIVFLKYMKDGFTNEMINIVNAFVNQAAISIENSRLLSEAIQNERYKEELTIARKIQKSLIPSDINQSEFYSISSITEAAEEVGGDYYDMYKFSENRLPLLLEMCLEKELPQHFIWHSLKAFFTALFSSIFLLRNF